MNKNIRKKKYILIVTELIFLCIFALFMGRFQRDIAIRQQTEVFRGKFTVIEDMLREGRKAEESHMEQIDNFYYTKVNTAVYMIHHADDYDVNVESLRTMADRMWVTNFLVIDGEGNILTSANETRADFTRDRFNQLRKALEAPSGNSVPFTVDYEEFKRRYYGAKLDDSRIIVLEQATENAEKHLDIVNDVDDRLGHISLGNGGRIYAVSARDNTFTYHPRATEVGADALDAGVEEAGLRNGTMSWMTIDGVRLFCGTYFDERSKTYYILAMPQRVLYKSGFRMAMALTIMLFAVMTLVFSYGYFVYEELVSKEPAEKFTEEYRFFLRRKIARKISTAAGLGFVAVLVMSVYAQMLFSLSSYSIDNVRTTYEVEETILDNEEHIKALREIFDDVYLDKCQMVAELVGRYPELGNHKDLKELERALDVEGIYIFDAEGKMISTSTTYQNFEISKDPNDQSYDFNRLLQGVTYYIQDISDSDVSGQRMQYIGVTIFDEEGTQRGFAQISIVPERLVEALDSTTLDVVLTNAERTFNGIIVAVNKETGLFSYNVEPRLIGRDAKEYGITEASLHDGFSDYLVIQDVSYFASCLETNNDYILIARRSGGQIGREIFLGAVTVGCFSFIVFFVFYLLACTVGKNPDVSSEEESDLTPASAAEVRSDIHQGVHDRTANRWGVTARYEWSELTAEQKVSTVFRILATIFAFALCICVGLRERLFGRDSILMYIYNQKWERGVNIFSITACLMMVCVMSVVLMLMSDLLKYLAKSLGARTATIMQLFRSFLKYITWIIVLYESLAMFGIDAKTLLTTAGILTVIIGLGAQSLIADILAGLFIIFEGDFRVGDVVTIDDWRGTVLEIGVRTTKIEEIDTFNVKIFSNSSISGVINMTKKYSNAIVTFGVEYGESLERIEAVLYDELPHMKERIPTIVAGPFYRGVTSFGDSSVNLRIDTTCREIDRTQTIRDINRDLKLILDKHDISMPFPHIVTVEEKNYQKATGSDLILSENFKNDRSGSRAEESSKK